MASPIFGLEFFKAGDYTKHNKGNWRVDHEIKNVLDNFFEDRKKGISVPIFWSPKKGHDTVNAIRVGSLTNAHLKGEVIVGDGQYMDEYRPLIEKKGDGVDAFGGLESVSATFTADQKRLKNIVLLGGEPPQIKGLKPVYEAVFSGDDEGIVIEFSMEKEENQKEKPMKENEMTFSKAEVELEVKNATETKEKELKLEFSQVIAEKDTEIKTLTERTEQLTGELKEANDKILEFSAGEKKREEETIKKRVMALSENGIKTPDECKEILERLLVFSKNENTKGFVEIDLERYEKMEPAVNHEFSRGKVKEENVSGDISKHWAKEEGV